MTTDLIERVCREGNPLIEGTKVTWVWRGARARYNPALKIWLDADRFEYLLEANQRMADTLRANDYDVTYREYNGGHNYTA
jgi:enterochelin esterase-like enzyme